MTIGEIVQEFFNAARDKHLDRVEIFFEKGDFRATVILESTPKEGEEGEILQ